MFFCRSYARAGLVENVAYRVVVAESGHHNRRCGVGNLFATIGQV